MKDVGEHTWSMQDNPRPAQYVRASRVPNYFGDHRRKKCWRSRDERMDVRLVPDVRIPHLYGFSFSEYRYVGRLGFAPPASSFPLTSSSHSLHMSHECRFTFVSGSQSDTTSATFSGTRPSHATPSTLPAYIFLQQICCSSTLARIQGVCFLAYGGGPGRDPLPGPRPAASNKHGTLHRRARGRGPLSPSSSPSLLSIFLGKITR